MKFCCAAVHSPVRDTVMSSVSGGYQHDQLFEKFSICYAYRNRFRREVVFVEPGEILIANTAGQGGNMIDVWDFHHRRHRLWGISLYKFLAVETSDFWSEKLGKEARVVSMLLPKLLQIEVWPELAS